jgi:hypothetical protein
MASGPLDNWRSKLGTPKVDLEALQRDLDDLDGEIGAREAAIEKTRAELEDLRSDREALLGLRNFMARTKPAASVPSNGGTVPRAGGRTKRDAILAMLADGQALHTSAIRKILVGAGEMRPDQAAYHSLQVTLSQMYRAEELERPGRGIYRLPAEAL